MKKLELSLYTLAVALCLPAFAFAQGRIEKLPASAAAKHDVSKPLREITPLKAKTNRKDFEPKRPAEPGG